MKNLLKLVGAIQLNRKAQESVNGGGACFATDKCLTLNAICYDSACIPGICRPGTNGVLTCSLP